MRDLLEDLLELAQQRIRAAERRQCDLGGLDLSAIRSGRASSPAPKGIDSAPTRSIPSASPSTSGWNMIQWNRFPTSPSGIHPTCAPRISTTVRTVFSASS